MIAIFALTFILASPSQGAERGDILSLYQTLHQHPELSRQETRTARLMAEEFRAAGLEVSENVGGLGVVGILRNGAGHTLLLRADMDALPVMEETKLPYASTVPGVMHACGHDLHMSVLVAAARYFASHRDTWRGTLVFVAQPAEETVTGASGMLNDGLYKRFPKPRYAFAFHSTPALPAGKVGWVSGPALAGASVFDVVIKGRGGHGAMPHLTIDPVVLSAQFILDIQTIPSRALDPTRGGVVTVGAIQGGTRANIIPDEVTLRISTRAFGTEDLDHIARELRQRAEGLAASHGAPKPTITETMRVGPTINSPALVQRLVPALNAAIGKNNLIESPRNMASEDFSAYASNGVESVIFWLGAANPQKLARATQKGQSLPNLHSSGYAPEAQTAIETGLETYKALVKFCGAESDARP
jgi:hippurate hydrolase